MLAFGRSRWLAESVLFFNKSMLLLKSWWISQVNQFCLVNWQTADLGTAKVARSFNQTSSSRLNSRRETVLFYLSEIIKCSSSLVPFFSVCNFPSDGRYTETVHVTARYCVAFLIEYPNIKYWWLFLIFFKLNVCWISYFEALFLSMEGNLLAVNVRGVQIHFVAVDCRVAKQKANAGHWYFAHGQII